jgi:hypothetical protein
MEKLIIKLTIKILKSKVGKPCKEEDDNASKEWGCFTCRTYRVIKFLEEWLKI